MEETVIFEAVRLVVWDLDGTFWKGTVTEGGISYIQEHHDIVIELARRGIMSSICSKNDKAMILPILEESGILEYFIFPSISWEPKGVRLSGLIEAVQLRASTVMFVDDNPSNRAEAVAMVPGIQVEDESFIAQMLADPRFKGKDDSEMTRLKQYKVIESRKQDEQNGGWNNEEFLRSCDIRICIEYDVMANVDRAIELINRTNQLNFTKKRLSENIEEAREVLRSEMNYYARQAGLVRVADKYGDYGFVGFFETEILRRKNVPNRSNSHLRHYCFSCRTLGMFIEQWLYEYLQRPELNVIGEVLTDLSVPRDIDWVRLVPSIEQSATQQRQIASQLLLYGGCEANAVGVYLQAYTGKMEVYGNYTASGLFSRINGATLALDICDRDLEKFSVEADILGLPLHLSAADIFPRSGSDTAFVFNCSLDAVPIRSYRHRTGGWTLWLEPRPFPLLNLVTTSEEKLLDHLKQSSFNAFFTAEQRDHVIRVARHIRENYILVDPMCDAERVLAMRELIARVPKGSKFIIAIDHDEVRMDRSTVVSVPAVTRYAALMRAIARDYLYVGVVSFSEVLNSQDEIQVGGNHYNRAVYLRFAERIIDVFDRLSAKPQAGQRTIQILDLYFNQGGNARPCFGPGWSSTEKNFTWTIDDESVLSFDAPTAAGAYALRMTRGAFIYRPDLSRQRMEILVNGTLVATTEANVPDVEFEEIKLDGAVFAGPARTTLLLRHPDAARPCDWINNKDGRRLAFCFKRLTLVRLPPVDADAPGATVS